jgi:hypothetical protein
MPKRSSSPEMPVFIQPQLATLKAKPPIGPPWLHEINMMASASTPHQQGEAEGLHGTLEIKRMPWPLNACFRRDLLSSKCQGANFSALPAAVFRIFALLQSWHRRP